MQESTPKSKKAVAYQEIKSRLLNGTYSLQDPLVERQLCQDLGLSRTPIREALFELASDGFVEIIEGKGVFVRKVSLRDLVELFEVRLALETLAIRLFTERSSPDNIRHLRSIFDTAEEALSTGNNEKFMEYDMYFHKFIAHESKNTRLEKTITSNYDLVQLMANSVRNDPELCRIASQNHRAIMEAIEKRDKQAAIQCMEEHIMQVMRYHQDKYYLFG